MSLADVLRRTSEKLAKVFEAGKKKEWSEFWDVYQQNGKRRGYSYSFYGNQWDDVTFKPKYDIVFSGTGANNNTSVFQNALFTDFTGILERQGVVLDTSAYNGSVAAGWFENCQYVTRIPVISISNSPNGANTLFYNCKNLHTIEKLVLSENGSKFTNKTFYNCNALKEIRFEGKIASDINFGDCGYLSLDSIVSTVNALSDTVTGMTCKFCGNSAFINHWDDVIAPLYAAKPNWTFISG